MQWDLTCKFLETKASNIGTTLEERKNRIKNDSTTWGSYLNTTFNITKGKYSTNDGNSYTDVNGNYTRSASAYLLLTTGTTERCSSMNIYDFAGNEYEWTLEYTNNTTYPCSGRGGNYTGSGSDYPASFRHYDSATYSYHLITLRVALY